MIVYEILLKKFTVNMQNVFGRISLLTLRFRGLNGDFFFDSPNRLKEAVSLVKGLSG